MKTSERRYPLGNRPDLVFAVGVERGDRQLGRLGGGHVDDALAAAVTDDDLALRHRRPGSDIDSVAIMPSAFSVSRWEAKKPPGS